MDKVSISKSLLVKGGYVLTGGVAAETVIHVLRVAVADLREIQGLERSRRVCQKEMRAHRREPTVAAHRLEPG